jgi:hypothetical protein
VAAEEDISGGDHSDLLLGHVSSVVQCQHHQMYSQRDLHRGWHYYQSEFHMTQYMNMEAKQKAYRHFLFDNK